MLDLNSFLLFIVQIFNYGVMVVNFRAVAHASYLWTGVSDFAAASMSFFIISRIARSESKVIPWLGYAIGGVVGSLLGIYISLKIHGK